MNKIPVLIDHGYFVRNNFQTPFSGAEEIARGKNMKASTTFIVT